jgi:hypothetical protein
MKTVLLSAVSSLALNSQLSSVGFQEVGPFLCNAVIPGLSAI